MTRPVLLIAGIAVLASCTKEDLPDTFTEVLPTAVKTVEYLPVYPGSDAVLYSVNEVFFNEQAYGQAKGKARAFFPENTAGFLSAGTVKVQDTVLNFNNHTYSYNPDQTNPEGIDFFNSGAHRWNISGSTAFPEVNFMCTRSIPEIFPMVTTSTVIYREKSFGINTQQYINDADSLRYTIFSMDSYIYANRDAKTPLHVFTPDQLTHLTPGPAILRLTAYNVNTLELNGKILTYINQSITDTAIEIK